MKLYSAAYRSFSYDNIEACVRHKVATIVYSHLPRPLNALVDSDYFEFAVQFAATLEFLVIRSNHIESIKQMNRLWEQLVIIGNKAYPFEDACKFIIEHICDTDDYSFVTETDVSDMLDRYCHHIRNGSFRLPYKFDPSSKPNKVSTSVPSSEPKKNPVFDSIFEVVEKMEPPSELEADDLTRLLLKILEKRVDKQWLLNLVLQKIVNMTEYSHHMSRSFDCFMNNLFDHVQGIISSKLFASTSPLRQLIGSVDFRVSVEVLDLLYVAELRRLVEGKRFINRTHIFWAYFELENGLPERFSIELFKCMIPKLNDYPPYDIYLASVKLVEYFGDKVRLENFLYAVLYVKDYVNLDEDQGDFMQGYQDFLTELRCCSSNCHDLEGPICIKDKNLPGLFQDIQLEFKW